MQESNKTKCKKCGEIKYRIQKGFFSNGRDKRWVDDKDTQWMGTVCPTCNIERVKESYKKRVEQKKYSEEARVLLTQQAQELKLGYEDGE